MPGSRFWWTLLGCVASAAAALPFAASAEPIDYQHDALGRLTRVVGPGDFVRVYVYDASGNIVQVISATLADLPRLDQSQPAVLNRDETIEVELFGAKLAGAALSSLSAGVSVVSAQVLDDAILARLRIDAAAPLGDARFRAATTLGTAELSIPLAPARPRVESVQPPRGSALGGTVVVVHGNHFTPDTSVRFDGMPLQGAVVVDERTIAGITPPGPPGATVEVAAANTIGMRMRLAYRYVFPFSVPGAVAVLEGGDGVLRIDLFEASPEPGSASVSSSAPGVAAVPDTIDIAAGAASVDVPISGVGSGQAVIRVVYRGFELSAAVLATGPFAGPVELIAATLSGLSPPARPSAALSALAAAPRIALVAGQVDASGRAVLELGTGALRTVAIPLEAPAPAGGTQYTVETSSAGIVAFPASVDVAEGSALLSLDVEALASGVAVLTLRSGAARIEIEVRVDRPHTAAAPPSAPPIGVLPAPIDATTAAPVGALATAIRNTSAAPVGVRVDGSASP